MVRIVWPAAITLPGSAERVRMVPAIGARIVRSLEIGLDVSQIGLAGHDIGLGGGDLRFEFVDFGCERQAVRRL